MKKFILSLVTFVIGLLGVAICLVGGTVIKNIYTRTGIKDSMAEYSYKISDAAGFGLFLFGLIAIIGLIFSFINAKKDDLN